MASGSDKRGAELISPLLLTNLPYKSILDYVLLKKMVGRFQFLTHMRHASIVLSMSPTNLGIRPI